MTDPAHSYETHITVAANQESLAAVRAWAGAQGIKWTHILLDRGQTPSQPMLTFWGTGSVSTLRARANEIADAVQRLGAEVVRIKIEASIENPAVPGNTAMRNQDDSGYFEYHFKLLLPGPADLGRVTDVVAPWGARLSRNARRHRDDGCSEHFVTQRATGVDRILADAQCEQLRTALQLAGYDILEVEAEYVVLDSNLSLDLGWLERGVQQ